MTTFVYFAYGSNMLAERLRAETRCPSARAVGIGVAQNFRVHFTKRSRDGSGKAALIREAGASAFGVLFAIDTAQCASLDAAEGHGYEPKLDFSVTEWESGKTIETRTYTGLSEYLDKKLHPYDWYRALVLAGAMQNKLPPDYVEALRGVLASEDPDGARPTRLEALRVLKQSGYETLLCG